MKFVLVLRKNLFFSSLFTHVVLVSSLIPFSACVRKRPPELVMAEQNLLDVAVDETVVRTAPEILEKAARTYHRAEITWRNTASKSEAVPLAVLGQELIVEARQKVEREPVADNLPTGDVRYDPLLLEKRVGLGQFDGNTFSAPPADSPFARNRIDFDKISRIKDSESLETSLFFFEGLSVLSPNGRIALIPINDYLRGNTATRLIIEVRISKLNLKEEDSFLAENQAQAVRNYFIVKGVSPDRIKAYGITEVGDEVPQLVFRYFDDQ